MPTSRRFFGCGSDFDLEPDVVTIFERSHEHFRIVLETGSAQDERVIIP